MPVARSPSDQAARPGRRRRLAEVALALGAGVVLAGAVVGVVAVDDEDVDSSATAPSASASPSFGGTAGDGPQEGAGASGPPSGEPLPRVDADVAPPLVDLAALPGGFATTPVSELPPPVGGLVEAAACDASGSSGTGQGWASAGGALAQQDVLVLEDEATAQAVLARLAGGPACPAQPRLSSDVPGLEELPADVVASRVPSAGPDEDVLVLAVRRGPVVSALVLDAVYGPTLVADVAGRLAEAVCAEPAAGC